VGCSRGGGSAWNGCSTHAHWHHSHHGDDPNDSGPRQNNYYYVRFGPEFEDAAALELDAHNAERAIGVHGVSVRRMTPAELSRLRIPSAIAPAAVVERSFVLHKTGKAADHYTLQLVHPVTEGEAQLFNSVFKDLILSR
jgi:hypothetical protein